MMKIGILTFHYSYNYGAVLQCYGLVQTLHRLGFKDVEVIDVVPRKWHWFLMGIPLKLSLEAFRKALIKLLYWKQCKKEIDAFRKMNLPLSVRVAKQDLPSLASIYDAIIVGSDQVWTPSQRKDDIYFLNWNPQYEGVKIAYAPCCAIETIKESQREILKSALNKFDKLSARNITTRNFVMNLIKKEVPLMPDPSILANYESIAGNVPIIREDYVLSFVIGSDLPEGNEIALQHIRNKLSSCKIISVVVPKQNPVIVRGSDIIDYACSPSKWLNLIRFAKFVFTDSFHCAVFSMKFHKCFAAYYVDAIRKSRFEDLSCRFGVNGNVVTNISELDVALSLPAINCDDIFETQRQIGEKFLSDCLT